MNKTKIEWTEATWNPVTGCTPITIGCEHCYAARIAWRLRGRHGYPEDDPFRVTRHPDRLNKPLRFRKPRMIFVCSMGDLFHEDMPDEYIVEVFKVMAACPQHTFQVLTKRPGRAHDVLWQHNTEHVFVGGGAKATWPLPNAWLGVSVENQRTADERIPLLLETPAACRFVSIEPMLGPVDLEELDGPGMWWDALRGHVMEKGGAGFEREYDVSRLDWVIVGGETGPGARPMQSDWVRAIRDECVKRGVPFFFKQWGSASPERDLKAKKGGRILDGRTWDEMPNWRRP